ncbi:RHS repeat-associated core domain-containing protein [Bradyrhizobium sp. LjRoot220]|uniref:RHS repeat-associated core domain-containing protein n=1 Tax=Bradyrhizobium sp. LjRoot220 TaxID=3342284 RepID=UPI003ED15036
MGQDSPIDGAAAIVGAYVAQDLLSDPAKPLSKVIITSLTQRWFMDQLINNAVNVTIGSQSEQFMLLADGSYNPRPGSSSRLSLNGGAYTMRYKEGAALNFNSAGNASTLTTPAGVTTTFNYNAASPPLLTSVTNNFGRALTLSYNGSNQLIAASDNSSPARSVSYTYDASGDLVSSTDPLGKVTTFSYAPPGGTLTPGLLAQVFTPSGTALVTNTYDSLGRVMTQANANNASSNNTTWNYYFAGYRSEENDPYGTRHVLYYNPLGKPLFEIQDFAGLNRLTANAYDGLNRLSSSTTPEGSSVAYTYDSVQNPWANNVASVTRNPKPGPPLASLTTTYSYDPIYNKPASVTDPRGLVSTMSYDGATGNLTTSISDVGGSPHFNARTSFTYNGVGQVLTATDPLGAVTRFTYDNSGNQTSIVRDAGAGHLNQITTIGYSAVGDPISVTDPRGNTATSSYDAARRPITTTAPNDLVTTNSYDAEGRVIQVQESTNGTVLRTTSATYTLTGKPATTTDANNNTASFSYDLLDRVLSVKDAMGRTTGYGYDALSRQVSISNPAIQGAPLLQKNYTANGLLASLTDANNRSTSLTYDRFDRPTTTTYPLGSTETLTYDADSNVTSRTTRAGAAIAFSYDTLNRLATKTPPAPATVVSYRYDLAGRLISVSDSSAAIAAAVPPSVDYVTNAAYDKLNRPTGLTWSPAPLSAAPTASSVTFGHSYNKANQRVGQTVTDNGWFNYPAATPSTVSYSADALNRYTAVGAVSPTYDGNSNLTSDGTFTLGYDTENRLISASGAGNTASYTYDAQGRRKTKTVNGTTTVFVTDVANREVLEYDGTSGAVLRWYAYGLGSNDVLNQMNVAAATRATFVPDILGSVIASVDSSSGTLSKIGYQPYGKSAGGSAPFGYTGQRIDPETSGLYYYRARHYSPAWGRFLQADPIGAQGGINLYAYVHNDPLNLIDPNGFAAAGFSAGFQHSLFGPDAVPLSSALQNGSLAFNAGAFVGIQAGAFVGMLPFLASDGAFRVAPAAGGAFSQAERAIIREGRSIVTSPQMAELAAAHSAGESLTVRIGGRMIQYEPNLPASGMTMFGENGFLIGRPAFATNAELNMTVLHELYRLRFSNAAAGVSGQLAAQETQAAAAFAARAAGRLP